MQTVKNQCGTGDTIITIYFETEVVAASIRFIADDYEVSKKGELRVFNELEEVARFVPGTWKYVDITDFEVPVKKEEKRIISRNPAMQSSESIV